VSIRKDGIELMNELFMTRDEIRGLLEYVSDVGSRQSPVTWRVQDGKLYAPGLLAEHRELVGTFRDEIIHYLTTPPDIEGQCINQHPIGWYCTKYGTWLCECYRVDRPLRFAKPKKARVQWAS
jgi:hypothetical protein